MDAEDTTQQREQAAPNATPAERQPFVIGGSSTDTEKRIVALKKRLVREGVLAVSMLESAINAFRAVDVEGARQVRRADDEVDTEEVEIEQESYELLSLHQPYARGFRTIAFALRANADFERVADHASSIAKVVTRMQPFLDSATATEAPNWPTALLELMDRVPRMCHELLRAVLDEDAAAARKLVEADSLIDQQERRLFEEVQEWVRVQGRSDGALAMGMLLYRAGRELERVGDLMASVAEDVVYLAEGQIIRHAKRKVGPTSSKPS